ncbi:hypothetical protein BDW02DRAFT_244486 [Decorospora gaudefroyi]|uniref:Uncharacterized protein n=1 Tax=Decorospora gaudefroyi TaxID=184978 RepID=A0A6A5KGK3_9PLEO|nr:hypothetical protein BDW02DRAFT_244486 [Decorospora gaudefroyi]
MMEKTKNLSPPPSMAACPPSSSRLLAQNHQQNDNNKNEGTRFHMEVLHGRTETASLSPYHQKNRSLLLCPLALFLASSPCAQPPPNQQQQKKTKNPTFKWMSWTDGTAS